MALCCPPGRGCNCSREAEPCILALCRAAPDHEHTALALERWEALQCTPRSSRPEWRFRRRAYERARDGALAVLLMRADRASLPGGGAPPPSPAGGRRPQLAA